ncbi:hypothetical protein [Streptomyces albicerus]|uniref:hypothetical protein n=1 Tax=Streptomyces albicerus TaxID=2569859 RepID=UPI00124BA9DA|nr:hypothetical protein [Streptomyces albicerus]
MGRVRVAFGLLVVVVGTVWLSGGGSTVRSGGRWALSALPYVLVALGLLLVLRAAVPRGLLAAPLVLIAGGGLWAAYDAGYLGGVSSGKVWPGLVIALGATLALGVRPRPAAVEDELPFRRYRSVLLPVRKRVAADAVPLRNVAVSSWFGDARIDLSGAEFTSDLPPDGGYKLLEVDVMVCFGRVELVLPPRCAVVRGSVENTLAVHYADRVAVYADTDTYRTAVGGVVPRRVLLNVLGLGGSVAIRSL